MEIDIAFEYTQDNTHHELIGKAKQQIGNQLDDLFCQKHNQLPHITIVNIMAGQEKDTVEFKPLCCCVEFNQTIIN